MGQLVLGTRALPPAKRAQLKFFTSLNYFEPIAFAMRARAPAFPVMVASQNST